MATPKTLPRPLRVVRTRQERGVRTEEAIIQSTVRLLSTRGIQGTSLDALALEAGTSKSSILWHFKSKEELLLRVAERVVEDVAHGPVQRILALPTLDARAAASWGFFIQTLRERTELRRLIPYLVFESAERPELRARLQHLYRSTRELFERGLEGVVADPAERQRLAILGVATFDGIFLQWMLDPDAIDLDALVAEVPVLMERARRARAGNKE
jgi:TetR/AcrR family transcriptional regulator